MCIGYTRDEQREEEDWSARDERGLHDLSQLGKCIMSLNADEVELIIARRKAERENADALHGNIDIDPDWDKREETDNEHRS